MRITFIINESDGATLDQLRSGIEARRAAGDEVRARLTFEAGDAIWMATEACATGCDLLVAAGGDGTINEVVNGIDRWMRASAGGREPPRLGIIPLGTANDLAAELQIPQEVERAVEVAVSGEERVMDVARLEERCFLNVSTGGFGAEATEEAPPEAKRVLGPLAYLVTGVRKFASLEPLTARVSTPEGTIAEGRFLLFAVGNSRRTGGGNVLTPAADPSDGLLDLCLVREISRVEFLRLLPQLRAGEHIGHPAVVYLQLPGFTLESEEELSVNADGEPTSGRRFRYGLAEWRVRVRG